MPSSPDTGVSPVSQVTREVALLKLAINRADNTDPRSIASALAMRDRVVVATSKKKTK